MKVGDNLRWANHSQGGASKVDVIPQAPWTALPDETAKAIIVIDRGEGDAVGDCLFLDSLAQAVVGVFPQGEAVLHNPDETVVLIVTEGFRPYGFGISIGIIGEGLGVGTSDLGEPVASWLIGVNVGLDYASPLESCFTDE